MRTFIFCYYPDDDNRNPIIYHITAQDGKECGSWYQQTRSMNGFEQRLLERWYKYQPPSNGFMRIGKFEHTGYLERGSTEYKFSSVWEFFKTIGYDHKNKSVKHLDIFLGNWEPINYKIEQYFNDKE